MATEICNIGRRETSKRRLLGIAALIAGIGLAFVLVIFGASRFWRLIVFLPFWMAGLGLFQAQEKVCIALAARGLQNMDDGEIQLEDAKLAGKLKEKARKINRKAILTAVFATLLTLIP